MDSLWIDHIVEHVELVSGLECDEIMYFASSIEFHLEFNIVIEL